MVGIIRTYKITQFVLEKRIDLIYTLNSVLCLRIKRNITKRHVRYVNTIFKISSEVLEFFHFLVAHIKMYVIFRISVKNEDLLSLPHFQINYF